MLNFLKLPGRLRHITFLAERVSSFLEQYFVLIVVVLTLLYVVPNSLLSLFKGGGNSLLRDKGIIWVLVYLIVWCFVSVPVLCLIYKKNKNTFLLIGLLMMFAGLVGIRVWVMGRSPLASDAQFNYSFLEGYDRHKDLSLMDFYNASMRPENLDLEDPRLLEHITRLNREEWVKKHWCKDIVGNIRCALTPPLFFYLIFCARSVIGWIPGWYLLFCYMFSAGSLLVLWLMVSRHTNQRNAALLVFSFAQCSAFVNYSAAFGNDSAALFLFFLGLYFLDRSIDSHPCLMGSLSGVAFGAAMLIRLSYVPMVVLVGILVLLCCPKRWTLILSTLLGMGSILLVFFILGFDPVILLVTSTLTRSGYIEHMERSVFILTNLIFLIQFITGLGFGWFILVLRGFLKPHPSKGAIPFWQSRWTVILLPLLLLVTWSQEPQRMFGYYPLLLGVGLRTELLSEELPFATTMLASLVAVVLTQQIF